MSTRREYHPVQGAYVDMSQPPDPFIVGLQAQLRAANLRPFPMPNSTILRSIVVASCPYIDDQIALVLLLNKEAPFFTVAHYYLDAMEAAGDVPARPAGYLHVLATEANIVPAVREYEQSGGDY